MSRLSLQIARQLLTRPKGPYMTVTYIAVLMAGMMGSIDIEVNGNTFNFGNMSVLANDLGTGDGSGGSDLGGNCGSCGEDSSSSPSSASADSGGESNESDNRRDRKFEIDLGVFHEQGGEVIFTQDEVTRHCDVAVQHFAESLEDRYGTLQGSPVLSETNIDMTRHQDRAGYSYIPHGGVETQWSAQFNSASGVTEMVVHCAIPTDGVRADAGMSGMFSFLGDQAGGDGSFENYVTVAQGEDGSLTVRGMHERRHMKEAINQGLLGPRRG